MTRIREEEEVGYDTRKMQKKDYTTLPLSLSQWVCLGLKTKMTSCKEDIKITCKLVSCNECSQVTTLQTM